MVKVKRNPHVKLTLARLLTSNGNFLNDAASISAESSSEVCCLRALSSRSTSSSGVSGSSCEEGRGEGGRWGGEGRGGGWYSNSERK